jgi:hypothetical protein
MYNEEKLKIRALREKAEAIKARAKQEGRALAEFEREHIRALIAEAHRIEMEMPEEPLTLQGFGGQGKTSKGLSTDNGGFDGIGDFMAALYRKSRGEGFDERLKPLQIRAGQIGETVPSEGGFAVPLQFVERTLNEDLQDTVSAASRPPEVCLLGSP